MPLCPQITNTAVTVTQTADFTVSSVTPVVNATTSDTASLSTQITTAQNTANGKNTVTYSTSAPSGSGTNVGDIWWQYSAGIVIGQYSWNGSSWASSPISSAVIANLDAAKITSGIISSIEYNNGSGTFRVTAAGALTASSATITGTINATAGYIGSAANGWNLSSSGYLTNSGGSTILYPTTAPGGNSTTYSIYTDRGVYAERIFSSGTQASSIYSLGGLSVQGQVSGAAGSFVVNSSGNMTTVGSITSTGAITTSSNISTSGSGTITSAGAMTSNGDLSTPNHTSTTNAANGYVFTTGGRVTRSTASSRRYKENIVDIKDVQELDPKKLLDLPVRAFSYKASYLNENDDRSGMLMPGLIAEEVDAIYPVAADYVDGVESFNDRMILVGLLSLVQDLSKRVAELEKK
jgi:hypothetical protein